MPAIKLANTGSLILAFQTFSIIMIVIIIISVVVAAVMVVTIETSIGDTKNSNKNIEYQGLSGIIKKIRFHNSSQPGL
jgi:hypothetical protein